MEWQGIAVIGALIAFAVLAWWAKAQGSVQKSLEDALASARKDAEVVEKSHEAGEVADSRRDPVVHDVPDVVRPDTVPDWAKH